MVCVFVKCYCAFAILECLHYSPLHETATSRIVFRSVEGEVEYFIALRRIRKTTAESDH